VNKPFTSWTIGAPYYIPLFSISITAQWWAYALDHHWYATPLWLLALFTLNFFRDPPRKITEDPNEIVSPADGVVDGIEEIEHCEYFDGPCKRVSIFLNVFNVHINRMPDDCTIESITHKDGEYRNAMDPNSAQINESNWLRLITPHGPMTVRQISGAIARRIVCPAAKGGKLKKGQKFGMIKFGSRTELYLSCDADISVSLKQKVKGGSTIIARFNDTKD
jgi:phosphatidylserine decarboxylase